MSDKRQLNPGGVATVRKPRVVLVGGTATTPIQERFRQLDWDVSHLPTGDDLTCSVLARRPSAVLIPVETGWESGYLITAKLKKSKPKMRVVLVAPNRTPEAERFARFVGAVLVAETDGVGRLVAAVTG